MVIFCLKALSGYLSRGSAAFLLQSTFVMIRFALIKGKRMQSSLCLQDFTSKHEACCLAVGPKGASSASGLPPGPVRFHGFPHLQECEINAVSKTEADCWTRWCTGESSITLEMGGHHQKVLQAQLTTICQWRSGKSWSK